MKHYRAARDYKPERKRCWFVVANRSGAVIYKENEHHEFGFVYRFENPRGRRSEGELDSDRPGATFSSSGGGVQHSLDRHSHRHEDVAKKFSKTIGESLVKAAGEDRYDELVLVAEPHFLGLLREQIPQSLRPRIKYEIQHEYNRGSDQELRDHIYKAIESLNS